MINLKINDKEYFGRNILLDLVMIMLYAIIVCPLLILLVIVSPIIMIIIRLLKARSSDGNHRDK